MSKRPGPNKENLEETRRAFLMIARQEFSDHGFAHASTTRIVEKSGMARGSLYYHFGDKSGLFRAVYEEIMSKALTQVSEKTDRENNAWSALMAGCNAYLDLCMDPFFRKIILIESQAAMSFKERLMIQERTLLGKLRALLPDVLKGGKFDGHTPQTMAIFIFGLLGEIGRALDFSQNPQNDRVVFEQAFHKSMYALRGTAV